MREALKDRRVFPCLGIVTTDDDSGSHFDLDGEDLLVEVELVPGEERITARMGAVGGGSGQGLWFVPPVGSEVIVIMCDGELEADAFIVGVLSSGAVPEGIAPDVTVIANTSKVYVIDGTTANAEGVIKATPYDQHKHPTGTGPSGVPDNAGTAHTTVLEAK
jgi:hypothetical protein